MQVYECREQEASPAKAVNLIWCEGGEGRLSFGRGRWRDRRNVALVIDDCVSDISTAWIEVKARHMSHSTDVGCGMWEIRRFRSPMS